MDIHQFIIAGSVAALGIGAALSCAHLRNLREEYHPDHQDMQYALDDAINAYGYSLYPTWIKDRKRHFTLISTTRRLLESEISDTAEVKRLLWTTDIYDLLLRSMREAEVSGQPPTSQIRSAAKHIMAEYNSGVLEEMIRLTSRPVQHFL